MVDLKRVRKSEMLQHYGFLWTLTPVKNKVGTDDSAPDHFSFRVGMDAPTQPKPRRHSSSGSEDGLSGDEDERSRIDSDGMSSEGDIRTGELVLASIPETGGLIVEVKEKEQQFHQSQDCFTVDKVSQLLFSWSCALACRRPSHAVPCPVECVTSPLLRCRSLWHTSVRCAQCQSLSRASNTSSRKR
jgi:hypothetical protein